MSISGKRKNHSNLDASGDKQKYAEEPYTPKEEDTKGGRRRLVKRKIYSPEPIMDTRSKHKANIGRGNNQKTEKKEDSESDGSQEEYEFDSKIFYNIKSLHQKEKEDKKIVWENSLKNL